MSKRITKALWKKFRHQNVVGQDCQLITVTNAYTYWTGQVVSPEDGAGRVPRGV